MCDSAWFLCNRPCPDSRKHVISRIEPHRTIGEETNENQGRTSKDQPERSIAFLSQQINNTNTPGMIKCIPKRNVNALRTKLSLWFRTLLKASRGTAFNLINPFTWLIESCMFFFNFWVWRRNPKVWPFKWNLFHQHYFHITPFASFYKENLDFFV